MKIASLVIRTAAIALLAVPFSAQAESWTCKKGDKVHEIHIQLEVPGSPVPCSVVYKKVTEGTPDQTLWTASKNASFCEQKAKAVVDKQVSRGWSCEEETMAGAATAITPAN
jgi:hypothetical protein